MGDQPIGGSFGRLDAAEVSKKMLYEWVQALRYDSHV